MSDIVKPRFLKFVNKHDEVYVFNANGSPEWWFSSFFYDDLLVH
jgi:hypothetical protein